MKLTKSNLELLLSNLGIKDVQIVEDEKEADAFESESIISAFLASKEPVLRQKFETEILPEKLKEVAGQFGGKLKNSVRKLSGNQIKTSDLEGKTDEEVLEALSAFLLKDKDSSTESLREQLKSLSEGHNDELEKLKNDYEGKLTQKDSEFDDFHVESYLGKLVGELPLMGDDSAAKVSVLKNALGANYKPVWNREKKELELRDPKNPERLATLDQNTLLSPKAYAETLFKGLGMVKTDMSKEKAIDHLDPGKGNPNPTDMSNGQGLPFEDFAKNFEATQ